MYETGKWRREVMARYPETATPRYLAPPLAVLGVAGGTVVGLVGLVTGVRPLLAGFLAPSGYLVLVVAGALTAGRLPIAARIRLPAVLVTTHMAWGAGFLVGLPYPQRHS